MSPVRRSARSPLLLAALLAVATSLGAGAARAGDNVGLIVSKGSGFGREVKASFAARLKEEGINAEVFALSPGCDKVSRVNSVRKLLAYDVGVLVVFGTCTAQDAAEATSKVPIVLLAGYDPTGGRPDRPQWMGSNVTGLACRTSVPFLYDNMDKTVPLDSVGFLQCSEDDDAQAQLRDVQAAAKARSFELVVADATHATVGQMAKTFAPTQFVHVGWGCDPKLLGFEFDQLGKPLVTQSPGLSGKSLVFSLSANPEGMISEGASLAARLLRGDRPEDIPVAEVKRIDFTVDLQEALSLGLKVPFEVLQAHL